MRNEEYKKEILDMLESINDTRILKLIYGFTRSGYREEQAVMRISNMKKGVLDN